MARARVAPRLTKGWSNASNDHRVATALLSFEPYAYCARGECLSLSYHRSADATYEFLPRAQ